MGDGRDTSGLRHGAVGSSARSHFPRIPVKLENTYRLEPVAQVSRLALTKVIKDTFEGILDNKQYDEGEGPGLVKLLSDMIKEQVKSLGYQRYKIIATVALMPSKGTTLISASRFVWNDSSDTYAEYVYTNASIYAIGTVFTVFLD